MLQNNNSFNHISRVFALTHICNGAFCGRFFICPLARLWEPGSGLKKSATEPPFHMCVFELGRNDVELRRNGPRTKSDRNVIPSRGHKHGDRKVKH